MEITPQSNLLHVHVINFGTKSDHVTAKEFTKVVIPAASLPTPAASLPTPVE